MCRVGRSLQREPEKGASNVPGAADVPMEPGKDEQMAGRHAVASGEEENQHEENRMRDIHVGKSGAETANEAQPDKLRRSVRSEQGAPNTSSTTTTSSSSSSSCTRTAEHVFSLGAHGRRQFSVHTCPEQDVRLHPWRSDTRLWSGVDERANADDEGARLC